MQSIKINTSGAMQSLHGKLFLSFFKLIDYFLRNPFGPMQLYLPICSTPVAYYSFFCTDIIMTNWSLIKVSFKCITLIKVSFKRTLLSSSKAAAYYFIFVLLSFISYTFSRYHYTGGHGATAPWTTSSRMSSSVPWTSSAWLAATLGEASTGSELLSFKTHHNPCVLLALTTSPIQIIT